MRFKTLVLAASCLLIPFANAINIPDITQLSGPLTNTPVPAVGNGSATDPASTSFGTGTTSRLALYVPGTVYSDYPGWLAFYKALVFQGIPVTVTKDINVAKTYATVVAYQSLQSQYMGLTDGATWSTYVSGGKTLIAIGMTSTDASLKSAFGVTPNTNTNTFTRQAIVLQAPSATYPASSVNAQFDLTDVRDAQISIWSQDLNTGFPTIGYTLSASTAPNGVFALGSYLTSSVCVKLSCMIMQSRFSFGSDRRILISFICNRVLRTPCRRSPLNQPHTAAGLLPLALTLAPMLENLMVERQAVFRGPTMPR